MKITKVFIDGFKNVCNVNLFFHQICALVSPNNYGKSNVIDAISFGIDLIKMNEEARIQALSNVSLIPQYMGEDTKDVFTFKIEAQTLIDDKEFVVQYGYQVLWQRLQGSVKFLSENLSFKIKASDTKNNRFTTLINRSSLKTLYKTTEKGRCNVKLSIKDNVLSVNLLNSMGSKLFYDRILEKLNTLKFFKDDRFDPRYLYKPLPLNIKNITDLEINFINLPKIIYFLKEKEPRRFKRLVNAYKILFPDTEEIIPLRFPINTQLNENKKLQNSINNTFIEIDDALYALTIKSNYLCKAVRFEQMSAGAQRIFLILVELFLADLNNISLVAIEEPENSIHPKLFEAMIAIIRDIVVCSIILTSHSPYLISFLKSSDIYVADSKKSGIANFYPLTKAGQNKLNKEAQAKEKFSGEFLFLLMDSADEDLIKLLDSMLDKKIHF